MPCVALPVPTPPVLPSPFSIPKPPLPPIPDPSLCCQIHIEDYIPPIPPLPFPWPGPVNPAIVATVNQVLAQMQVAVQGYIDQLVPECPRS